MIDCEEALKDLLTCSLPSDQREMEALQGNKIELMVELNQMRMIEESMWRQKSRLM